MSRHDKLLALQHAHATSCKPLLFAAWTQRFESSRSTTLRAAALSDRAETIAAAYFQHLAAASPAQNRNNKPRIAARPAQNRTR
eukprot:6190884-Pleurochrysis_carterae.AAC.3